MRNENWSVIAGALLIAVLVAIAPVVNLLATNIGEFEWSEVIRPITISAALSTLLVVLASVYSRSWAKGSYLVFALLLLFFSYGQVYDWIGSLRPAGVMLGRHRYLMPVYIGAGGVALYWLMRRQPKAAWPMAPLLTMSVFLVVLPGTRVGLPLIEATAFEAPEASVPIGIAGETLLPEGYQGKDFYYIVLDGFGRSDVLKELYGWDNTAFLDQLRGMGFYVAERSASNYSVTTLSMAASLNMRYLDEVAGEMKRNSNDHGPVIKMIEDSLVEELLRSRGYKTVTFDTGYFRTTDMGSDVFLVPPSFAAEAGTGGIFRGPPSPFEIQLLDTTLAKLFLDLQELAGVLPEKRSPGASLHWQHYQRIRFVFSQLPEIADWEGSYFVTAHIIAPHPPFVFAADGSFIPHSGPFTLEDSDCCEPDEYIEAYRPQAQGISSLVLESVAAILESSDTEPVILIQGDHGPAAHWGPTLEDTYIPERMGILNAIYLPGGDYDSFYPSVTPVNTFRLIFDSQYGHNLGLLTDRSYYSPEGGLYDFQRVTDMVNP